MSDDTAHPTRTLYWKIYAALMILLLATVGAAYINLGDYNIVVALVIAVTKAVLVVVFFMHVRYNSKLIWLYASLGFIWMTYLLVGVFGDVMTRHWY
jgi:cytochrome c oxidase subunit IV